MNSYLFSLSAPGPLFLMCMTLTQSLLRVDFNILDYNITKYHCVCTQLFIQMSSYSTILRYVIHRVKMHCRIRVRPDVLLFWDPPLSKSDPGRCGLSAQELMGSAVVRGGGAVAGTGRV